MADAQADEAASLTDGEMFKFEKAREFTYLGCII